jgi:hypothetical protein
MLLDIYDMILFFFEQLFDGNLVFCLDKLLFIYYYYFSSNFLVVYPLHFVHIISKNLHVN